MNFRVKPYNVESITRALRLHKCNGLIRGWRPVADQRVIVDLVDSDSGFELRSLREAFIFVAGLASASHAYGRSGALPPAEAKRVGPHIAAGAQAIVGEQ